MLAAVWLAAPDRVGITAAAAWFDARLAREPLTLGESRESSVHRVSYRGPLGIEFEVVMDDNLVIVQGVFAVQ
jgi:hypothetical protein